MGFFKKKGESEKEQIEISGRFMGSIWKERSVRVFDNPHAVSEFLSKESLPYLWPEDKDFIKYCDSTRDPRLYLRMAWTAVYLHHPNPEVVLKVLQDHTHEEIMSTLVVINSIADLLFNQNEEIRSQAAKVVWTRNDAFIEEVFGIFAGPTDTRLTSMGPTEKERSLAAKALHDQCPPERSRLCEQLEIKAFGKSTA
jgi:hypothetical protein